MPPDMCGSPVSNDCSSYQHSVHFMPHNTTAGGGGAHMSASYPKLLETSDMRACQACLHMPSCCDTVDRLYDVFPSTAKFIRLCSWMTVTSF